MPWLVGTALDPLAGRHRQARAVQELDAAAGDPRLLPEPARHVPGALRGAGVGALVRGRSQPRHVHPRVPHHHDRRGADAVRLARAAAEVACRVRARRARVLPAVQQHPAGHRRGDGVRRHARAADLGRPAPGHGVGRPAVLQSDLHAPDAAAGSVAVGGDPLRLEARPPEGQGAHAAVHASSPPRCSPAGWCSGSIGTARCSRPWRPPWASGSHRLAGRSARSLAPRPDALARRHSA